MLDEIKPTLENVYPKPDTIQGIGNSSNASKLSGISEEAMLSNLANLSITTLCSSNGLNKDKSAIKKPLSPDNFSAIKLCRMYYEVSSAKKLPLPITVETSNNSSYFDSADDLWENSNKYNEAFVEHTNKRKNSSFSKLSDSKNKRSRYTFSKKRASHDDINLMPLAVHDIRKSSSNPPEKGFSIDTSIISSLSEEPTAASITVSPLNSRDVFDNKFEYYCEETDNLTQSKSVEHIQKKNTISSTYLNEITSATSDHLHTVNNPTFSNFETLSIASSSDLISSDDHFAYTVDDIHRIKTSITWKIPKKFEGRTESVCVISEDILTVLQENSLEYNKFRNIPMEYNETNNEWVLSNIFLPAGKYEFRFLVNKVEICYSKYLPHAKDGLGSIVNWFEIPPTVDTFEPITLDIDSDIEQNQTCNSISNYCRHATQKQEILDNDYLTKLCSNISLLSNSNPPPTEMSSDDYYSNEIPALFRFSDSHPKRDDPQIPFIEPPSYGEPSFYNNIVDCGQDTLFSSLQQNGAIDASIAENLLLQRYPVPELPVFFENEYVEKSLPHENSLEELPLAGKEESSILREDILSHNKMPHVNLNHLITQKISREVLSVAITTRYRKKYITKVFYSPLISSRK